MEKIKIHYPEGMKLHGDNACKHLGFEKYDWKTDRDKKTIFLLYTEDDYKYLALHSGKKIIIWAGTDVLHLANNFAGRYINTVRDTSITHVCMNHITQGELAAMGIHAQLRYLFFCDIKKYTPQKDLTKDVFMSANPGRGVEYGEAIFNALAWQFPTWTFHIFGIDPMIQVYCENVRYYGWVSEEEMDEKTKNFAVCLRYNRHDGFPQVMCKALLREQLVVTTIPYDYLTIVANNYDKLVETMKLIDLNFGEQTLRDTRVRDMINNFDFLE